MNIFSDLKRRKSTPGYRPPVADLGYCACGTVWNIAAMAEQGFQRGMCPECGEPAVEIERAVKGYGSMKDDPVNQALIEAIGDGAAPQLDAGARLDPTENAAFDRWCYATIDPDYQLGGRPIPLITTILYAICGEDVDKFEKVLEALRSAFEAGQAEERERCAKIAEASVTFVPGITPKHLRCGAGVSCPSVHTLEDGRLEITGEFVTATRQLIHAAGHSVATDEATIRISADYFSDLPEIACLRARVAELEARLEVDHQFELVDGEMTRVEIPPEERATTIDGIECRDATIALQETHIDKLRSQLREALEPISGITLGAGLSGKITEQEAIDLVNAVLNAKRTVLQQTSPEATGGDNG